MLLAAADVEVVAVVVLEVEVRRLRRGDPWTRVGTTTDCYAMYVPPVLEERRGEALCRIRQIWRDAVSGLDEPPARAFGG